MSTHRPTLDDVARIAEVSGKTVARVVNGEKGVGSRTRQRVLEAIDRLDYKPNVWARALAGARTYRLGVVSPHLSAYFVSQLHQGAERVCRERGYQLTIEQFDQSAPLALERFAEGLRRQPLDGVFLAAPLSDDAGLLDLLDEHGVAYVRHSPLSDPKRSDAVFADETAGSEAIARHLWAMGHRHFGITEGPAGHLASIVRHDAFVRAIREVGAGLGDESVSIASVPLGGMGPLESGVEAGRALCANTVKPTAIVAFNDEIAAGIIAFAHQNRIEVPNDLAVTGFGNADFSLMTWPQLTTVRQPNADMAAMAIEWLTSPAEEPRTACLPVELIVRGSTDGSKGLMTLSSAEFATVGLT